jgi:hypothetical protein
MAKSEPSKLGQKVIKLEDMKKRADGKLRFADKEATKRHASKDAKKAFVKKGDKETMKPEMSSKMKMPHEKPIKKHKKG